MDNQKSKQTEQGVRGELTYEDKVIQKIIGFALEHVDGLLTIDGGFFSNIAEKLVNTDNVTSGIDVEVGKEQVAVDLNVIVEYGKNVFELYENIKRVIVEQVKKMTNLEVVEVNVNVIDIKTKEQYEDSSVTIQDRVSDMASSTGEFVSGQTEKAKKALSKENEKIKENTEPRVE